MLPLHSLTRRVTRQHLTGSVSGPPRLHYAWVIVAVSALICMITSPVRFVISMLVPYLQSPQGFGWSYFAISVAFALQWLASALISPLVGWLGDRYGVRRTMLLGAYLFIAGMALTGGMTRLWHFYLYFGILLAIPLTIYQVPLVAGVAIWFKTHIGVAMGILQAVQGLGTVVAIPLVTVMFAHFGLAWTFWGLGLGGGLLLLSLIQLFHNEPAQKGGRTESSHIAVHLFRDHFDEQRHHVPQLFVLRRWTDDFQPSPVIGEAWHTAVSMACQ
jgi:MFS family permease